MDFGPELIREEYQGVHLEIQIVRVIHGQKDTYSDFIITLANMYKTPEATMKKAIIVLVVLCVFIVTPRSLAEDLLSPVIGMVDSPEQAAISSPPDLPIPAESAEPQPGSSPTTTASLAPMPSRAPSSEAKTPALAKLGNDQLAESSTVSSTSDALPPRAIANQIIDIATPTSVSTDPRAHSVFLPFLHTGKVETLLICGQANSAAVTFHGALDGVKSVGSGSSSFRISGPANLVMAALNGDMGARLSSAAKAIPGSSLSLTFVALSKPSIEAHLCDDGSASNNRTISIRALNMDLNMIKDDVRLK